MSKTIDFSFTEDDLKELLTKLCDLGEEMGYTPAEFAVLLTVANTHLCEVQGIEVMAINKLDG